MEQNLTRLAWEGEGAQRRGMQPTNRGHERAYAMLEDEEGQDMESARRSTMG